LTPIYIESILDESVRDQNSEDLDYASTLLFFDPEFETTEKYVDILDSILIQDWHHNHEDIALMLQRLRSPKSIDTLYIRALSKPVYMAYDETYSLARKCIHALADINTKESKEKLILLSKSEIPEVREKSIKQLRQMS
jgi:hypothetical protein